MRSYGFARNTLILLSSAISLSSAGKALADEQNRLPVVINNVHVPIGDLTINYPPPFDLGVCCSPNGVVTNPASNRIYRRSVGRWCLHTSNRLSQVSVIDGDVTNHSWNQIIKNIPITNNPALGGQFLAVNTKTNKIYAGVALSLGSIPPRAMCL